MGKYGDLIKQAKDESAELEIQQSGKPESQTTSKLANQTARKPASQKVRKPENQKTIKLESQNDEWVNLGIKVPLSWRRHWAAQSKLRGVPMTEVIVHALIDVFGKPE